MGNFSTTAQGFMTPTVGGHNLNTVSGIVQFFPNDSFTDITIYIQYTEDSNTTIYERQYLSPFYNGRLLYGIAGPIFIPSEYTETAKIQVYGIEQVGSYKKAHFASVPLSSFLRTEPDPMSIKKGFYLWTYGAGKNNTFSVHTKVLTNNPNIYPSQTYTCQHLQASTTPGYSYIPSDTDYTVAFSGRDVVAEILNENQVVLPYMVGLKVCCVGGAATAWDESIIRPIDDAIQAGQFSAYEAILWDVENAVVNDSTKNAFYHAFATTKAQGLQTWMTTSHTGPFQCSDPLTVMKWFFESPDVDVISPQLYTCDYGTASEYDSSNGILWIAPDGTSTSFASLYKARLGTGVGLEIIPSVFSNITTNGYYDLFTTAGTNAGRYPIDFYGSYLPPTFTVDYGVQYFFETVLGIPTNGSLQFSDGSIQLTGSEYSCDNNPQCGAI